MRITTEKTKRSAVNVPEQSRSKAVAAAVLEVVALGVVALVSYETLQTPTW